MALPEAPPPASKLPIAAPAPAAAPSLAGAACPAPLLHHERVLMAHGGGGRLMHQLIDRVIRPVLDTGQLEASHDGAVMRIEGGVRIAFTTDSYVVRPLVFPGGDIGTLAVNGTVNDLAMCGARPFYLSCGLILEEGLEMAQLSHVIASMRRAADAAGVAFVTGDTKVVDKGKGDGMYVNTAGIGVMEHALVIGPRQVRAGDAIVLSGDIGRHGVAILAARESLGFESRIESDCAPLGEPVMNLLREPIEIHCMRDLTRGGLAAALCEIASDAQLRLELSEPLIPVRDDVAGACEVLGLDPLQVACEGRFIAFMPRPQAELAVEVLRRSPQCAGAVIVGEVKAGRPHVVSLRTQLGSLRIVDIPSGELLPRIC